MSNGVTFVDSHFSHLSRPDSHTHILFLPCMDLGIAEFNSVNCRDEIINYLSIRRFLPASCISFVMRKQIVVNVNKTRFPHGR